MKKLVVCLCLCAWNLEVQYIFVYHLKDARTSEYNIVLTFSIFNTFCRFQSEKISTLITYIYSHNQYVAFSEPGNMPSNTNIWTLLCGMSRDVTQPRSGATWLDTQIDHASKIGPN